jgi:DNA topoisomerase-3
MAYIGGEVATVKANGIGIKIDTHKCPDCGNALRRIKKKEGNEFFWGCTGFADGCKYACEDKAGKPVPKQSQQVSEHKCMACGKGLTRRPGKKKGTFWWGCSGFPECKQTYPDNKGRPDYSANNKAKENVHE